MSTTTRKVMTVGRYMVAPIHDAEVRGHSAALGYFDSLPDACLFAHEFGCSRSPVAVYDSEANVDRYAPLGERMVHRTHG